MSKRAPALLRPEVAEGPSRIGWRGAAPSTVFVIRPGLISVPKKSRFATRLSSGSQALHVDVGVHATEFPEHLEPQDVGALHRPPAPFVDRGRTEIGVKVALVLHSRNSAFGAMRLPRGSIRLELERERIRADPDMMENSRDRRP